MDLILLLMFHICLCYTALSVSCSFVITCLERTELLTLFRCGIFFSISDLCLLYFYYLLKIRSINIKQVI